MILFAGSWKEHSVDYLRSEALARGLIRNAALALSSRPGGDGFMFWIAAALGGAGVLNVVKGLHQPKGLYKEVLHLRMSLSDLSGKEGDLGSRNTYFLTDFHLYTTILNPQADPQEYQLQPTKITFKTIKDKDIQSDMVTPLPLPQIAYTEVVIAGARVLTNSLR